MQFARKAGNSLRESRRLSVAVTAQRRVAVTGGKPHPKSWDSPLSERFIVAARYSPVPDKETRLHLFAPEGLPGKPFGPSGNAPPGLNYRWFALSFSVLL